MGIVVPCKSENMAQIKTILCLGNQTEDSSVQSRAWADNFGLSYQGLLDQPYIVSPGLYEPDLAHLSIDHIWTLTESVDLIILLDQPADSFDFVETYQHFIGLCLYKKHFMPVLIASTDAPNIWLTTIHNNNLVLPTIVERNIQDANLVIKLNTVNNVDLFKQQLIDLTIELKNRRCNWICYRAGPHEELHYKATQVLLGHSEFVFLNPGVFNKHVALNIKHRIYQHWVNLYLKKYYCRSY